LRVESCEIAWVAGWASDVSIWSDEIYERFSNFSHRFIDYSDLISSEEFVVPTSEIVVGWSMGTLVLLRNLHKKPKEQKWILVCPIADFCAPGCWSHTAVKALRLGIQVARGYLPRVAANAAGLTSFSVLFGDSVQKEKKDKWLENAQRYSPEQLIAGLDYLMQKKADLTVPCQNVELLFGKQDRVVPLAQKELFGEFEGQIHVFENLGHWLPDYICAAPHIIDDWPAFGC
jgi:pimeloyl-ACP methyl ester carboxylesterase